MLNLAMPTRTGLGPRTLLTVARADPAAFTLLWRHAAREPQFAAYAAELRSVSVSVARQLSELDTGDELLDAWRSEALFGWLVEATLTWLERVRRPATTSSSWNVGRVSSAPNSLDPRRLLRAALDDCPHRYSVGGHPSSRNMTVASISLCVPSPSQGKGGRRVVGLVGAPVTPGPTDSIQTGSRSPDGGRRPPTIPRARQVRRSALGWTIDHAPCGADWYHPRCCRVPSS